MESGRYKGYDYSLPGVYYFTICTKSKGHCFGEIINGRMTLSEIGYILKDEWLKTPVIRFDMNLSIGDYIIMPDHFHAIITIGENKYNAGKNDSCDLIRRDAMHRVSTDSVNNDFPGKIKSFGPQSKNLSSIIRGFKSAVTIRARCIDPGFAWQPRFYDHIIRTNADHLRISIYIKNNPLKWGK